MTLFEQILNEAFSVIYGPVSAKKINNAIDNRNSAIIRYKTKGENEHTQQRTIFPVAYGVNKKGNQVVRAYQTGGDTTTVKPGWKFFRVDRILSWYNMRNSKFDMRMLVNLGYNRDGDKLMTNLFNNVKTKAQTKRELELRKASKTDDSSTTEQPVITSTPITKGEVVNQGNVNPQSTGSDTPDIQTLSNNIDNNQIAAYNNSDNQTAQMTAPETNPISKKQINATLPNQNNSKPSGNDMKIMMSWLLIAANLSPKMISKKILSARHFRI